MNNIIFTWHAFQRIAGARVVQYLRRGGVITRKLVTVLQGIFGAKDIVDMVRKNIFVIVPQAMTAGIYTLANEECNHDGGVERA